MLIALKTRGEDDTGREKRGLARRQLCWRSLLITQTVSAGIQFLIGV